MRREKDLKRRIQELDSQIRGIRTALQEALTQMNSYGKQWMVQLKKVREAGFESAGDYGPLMEQMAGLTEDQLWDFPFGEAAGQMERLRRELEEYRAELKKRGEQLKESRQELEVTIGNLRKGIKPFPPQVQTLKRLLEEEYSTYEALRERNGALAADLLWEELQAGRRRVRVECGLLLPDDHLAMTAYVLRRRLSVSALLQQCIYHYCLPGAAISLPARIAFQLEVIRDQDIRASCFVMSCAPPPRSDPHPSSLCQYPSNAYSGKDDEPDGQRTCWASLR